MASLIFNEKSGNYVISSDVRGIDAVESRYDSERNNCVSNRDLALGFTDEEIFSLQRLLQQCGIGAREH